MRGRTTLAVVAGALLAGAALAQSGGTLEIRRATIDGGGGTASGSALRLTGTMGQPDAEFSSGGTLALRGGFWGAPRAVADSLFTNGFE